MKKPLSILALLASSALALAQPVQQSGSVTAGHAVQWVGSGVIKDAGTASNGFLTSLGVTNNGGPGICVQSAAPTAAARNQLCLSVTTDGGSKLSSYSYGTATSAGFTFDINGVIQGFPTVNLPVAAGNLACFLNTSGTLTDCGASPTNLPITVGSTVIAGGTNTRILRNSSGVVGEYTISGSGTIVAMAAGPTFTGVPAAPTAAYGTSTTQLATTAFVTAGTAPNVFPVICNDVAGSECTDFGTKLAACEAATGGEVVFPHGYFLLNAGYTANGACIVRGQGWQTFLGTGTTSAPGTIGTWLKQTTAAATMLTINTGSNGFQLRDVAFWNVQDADAPLWAPFAYPPVVINLSDGTKFQNILLFGTTQGIQLGRLTPSVVGSGNVTLNNIQGVCFTANGCINVVKAGDFISIDTTYFNSSIIGTLSTNIIDYAKANTVVIRMARADSPTITNHRSFENRYCLQFTSNSEGYTSRAMVSNMSCDHHQISLLVSGASTTAEVVNTYMTGQGTGSRGVQCSASCIVHITNATIDNMEQAGLWAEVADANIFATNLAVNNCNSTNTFGSAPVTVGAGAIATVSGAFSVTGTFCTIATNPGLGKLNSGYGRFQDTDFSLVDNADNTKVGAFQLSGLTTGVTRAWTMPDGDFTFAGVGLVQTLTNKTLTAPVMTAPVLGTPASGVMTNVTGLPLTSGVTGTLPVANGGTGNTGGSWSTSSPAITCGGGGPPTTSSATLRSETIGKKYFFEVTVLVTTLGPCTTQLNIAMPVTSTALNALSGLNSVTNVTHLGRINAGGTNLGVIKYDGMLGISSGDSIAVSGVIEIN